jgi:hypothetical protein
MIKTLESAVVNLLLGLLSFAAGYWLLPPDVFRTPLGELTVGTLAWGAAAICIWLGYCRYITHELEAFNKRLSESEGLDTKVVIDCPYCARKMRIPTGKRVQVKCPEPACQKEFMYGEARDKSLVEYIMEFTKVAFLIFAIFVILVAFSVVWEMGCCRFH